MKRLLVTMLALLAALVLDQAILPGGSSPQITPAAAQTVNPCGLAQVAFCDTFDTPYAGSGRSGQLDPSRWSVARLTENDNPTQGRINEFWPTDAMHCKTPVTGVLPDSDYFMCGTEAGESEHFMEAIKDGGNYVYNDARILQPFDFTGRTGTLAFDVDAKTDDSHTWWPEIWITDQPVPAPHSLHPGTDALPKNGVGFAFSQPCTPPGGGAGGSLEDIFIIQNYTQVADLQLGKGFSALGSGCYPTMPDMKNHFNIRISQSQIEIWASDPGGANFQEYFVAPGLNLPLTRGYVHIEHSQYNALKFDTSPSATGQQTYHWDNIGFDGPILPADRTYSVPDALTPGGDPSSINLGYDAKGGQVFTCCAPGVTWPTMVVPPFSLANVNLNGAVGATLDLNAYNDANPITLNYQFNGGPWHSYTGAVTDGSYRWDTLSIPVSLADLKMGTNTLAFSTTNETLLANIDLTIDPSASPVVGPVSTLTSTIAASAASIPADNKTLSTITVMLKDANGNPEVGQTVTLAANGGHSTITTTGGTTSSDGGATFTVQDGTAETVIYTATDATDHVTLPKTATVSFSGPGAAGSQPLHGDVNGDGVVNAVDSLCVLRLVAILPSSPPGCPLPPPGNPDVNGDGQVNALDALCVLQIVAQLGSRPACIAKSTASTSMAAQAAAPLATGAVRDATAAQVQLSLSPVSVPVGMNRRTSVAVKAALSGAARLGAWTLDLRYDPRLLKPITCSGSAGSLCNASLAAGVVRIVGASSSGLSGTQTLATVSFLGLGHGGGSESPALTPVMLSNPSGVSLQASSVAQPVHAGPQRVHLGHLDLRHVIR